MVQLTTLLTGLVAVAAATSTTVLIARSLDGAVSVSQSGVDKHGNPVYVCSRDDGSVCGDDGHPRSVVCRLPRRRGCEALIASSAVKRSPTVPVGGGGDVVSSSSPNDPPVRSARSLSDPTVPIPEDPPTNSARSLADPVVPIEEPPTNARRAPMVPVGGDVVNPNDPPIHDGKARLNIRIAQPYCYEGSCRHPGMV